MEALEVVEQWRAHGRDVVPAGGKDPVEQQPQQQQRRPPVRRGGQRRVQDMTEEEIVAMNNRSLAFLQAKMPALKVK
jgi:hypothetical protein